MPPFEYSPYRNRYVTTIADLIGGGDRAEAKSLIEIARLKAGEKQARARAWGGAVDSIGGRVSGAIDKYNSTEEKLRRDMEKAQKLYAEGLAKRRTIEEARFIPASGTTPGVVDRGSPVWPNEADIEDTGDRIALDAAVVPSDDTFQSFPTYEAGRRAQRDLWLTEPYQDRTVRAAVERWTGGPGEAPQGYIDEMRVAANASNGEKSMRDVSDAELNAMMDVQQRWEGWNPPEDGRQASRSYRNNNPGNIKIPNSEALDSSNIQVNKNFQDIPDLGLDPTLSAESFLDSEDSFPGRFDPFVRKDSLPQTSYEYHGIKPQPPLGITNTEVGMDSRLAQNIPVPPGLDSENAIPGMTLADMVGPKPEGQDIPPLEIPNAELPRVMYASYPPFEALGLPGQYTPASVSQETREVGRYETDEGLLNVRLAYDDLLSQGVSPEIIDSVLSQINNTNDILSNFDALEDKNENEETILFGRMAASVLNVADTKTLTLDQALDVHLDTFETRFGDKEVNELRAQLHGMSEAEQGVFLSNKIDAADAILGKTVLSQGQARVGLGDGDPQSDAQKDRREYEAALESGATKDSYLAWKSLQNSKYGPLKFVINEDGKTVELTGQAPTGSRPPGSEAQYPKTLFEALFIASSPIGTPHREASQLAIDYMEEKAKMESGSTGALSSNQKAQLTQNIRDDMKSRGSSLSEMQRAHGIMRTSLDSILDENGVLIEPGDPGKILQDSDLYSKSHDGDPPKFVWSRELDKDGVPVGLSLVRTTAEKNVSHNAASQAILVTFQKILDPDSVVRESEYARSAEGQSLRHQIAGKYEQLIQGGAGVPIEELEGFVDLAQQWMAAEEEGQSQDMKVANAYAIRMGLDAPYALNVTLEQYRGMFPESPYGRQEYK